MDNTLIYSSPTKINLFLHVLGQMENGYHQLQSYFQLLRFGDELAFTTLADDRVDFFCDQELLNNRDNLVVKAAELLKQKSNCAKGIDIALHKSVPAGSGLGGGSSNAAITLIALNQLWQLNWSKEALADLGLELGADVPFFIRGQSAFVEGIGERITPLNTAPRFYLLLFPDCMVNTGEIFSSPELTRNSKPITIRAFREVDNVLQHSEFRNDCQALVCEHYPKVKEALDWLNQYSSARMTGTGASVFAAFDNFEEASKIASLAPEGLRHVVSEGISELSLA